MIEHAEVAFGIIAVLGIFAQWFSWRIRIPAIVPLFIIGVLIGPVLGLIRPTQEFGNIIEPIVKLALAIILFEGGLTLSLHELKESGGVVRRLITVNSFIFLTLTAIACHSIIGLGWELSILIGSIFIITGPTVIIPILKHARLPQKISSSLKWEGIINDPIGVILCILFLEYFTLQQRELALLAFLKGLFIATFVSSLLSWGVTQILRHAIKRNHLPQYLIMPIIFVSVLLIYGVANFFQHEAGLLATTLFGIMLGNLKVFIIDELKRFKESITIILVSFVFILLTADLDPQLIYEIDYRIIICILLIIFVIRPVSIFLCTIKTGLNWREKIFLGLIAPRGIVTAALSDFVAITMLHFGHQEAEKMIPVVFLLIFTSVAFSGFFVGPLAKVLKLSIEQVGVLLVGGNPWSIRLARLIKGLGIPVTLADNSPRSLYYLEKEGIKIHREEVLSEFSEENLDLTEIGYVVAVTKNDAYNSLVCTRFAHDIGRQNVYQMRSDVDTQDLKTNLQGHFLFSDHDHYESIVKKHYLGWTLKIVEIDKDNLEEMIPFLKGPEVLWVMLMRQNGELIFNDNDKGVRFKEFDKIIIYTCT